MRKYKTKEIQRAELKKLVGTGKISCTGKVTKGKKVSQHEDGLRLILDVVVHLKFGKKLYLDHIWIAEKKAYYSRYEGITVDFRAEVAEYGVEGKVCLIDVYFKKYVRKGIKG
mgnify:CR=1 FL=1